MRSMEKEEDGDVQAAGVLQVAVEPEHTETMGHFGNPSSTSCDAVSHDGDQTDADKGLVESEQKRTKKLMQCLACEKVLETKMKRCRSCWSGCYCSKECREAHAADHGKLCNYIQELEEIEKNKRVMSVREANQVQRKLRNKLIRLVGERPILNCSLGNDKLMKYCKALWDTGAMVSLLSLDWLKENFPDYELLSIEEYLEGDDMHLCAANNTKVEVEGVVVLNFGIGKSFEIPVPFIVTKDHLENPIVGYNLIKHIVTLDIDGFPELLKNSCPVLNQNKADAVIALIQKDVAEECEAKIMEKTVIPAHSRYRIKCRTDFEASEVKQNVLFTPYPMDGDLELSDLVAQVKIGRRNVHVVVTNPTNREITLEKGTVLGSVESVSAIIPILPADDSKRGRKRPACVESVSCQDGSTSEAVGDESENASLTDKSDFPPVDLSHLPEAQRKMAEQMLYEERDVFCEGSSVVGDAPEFQMELNLTDNVPVIVPHRQIPRPFYEEVKNFINDLIANNWIRESKSSYSSPVVCVRKPCGGLRMCVDYRMLNKKIVSDKMPIPRVQELLDGLDGQEWFSTLDMTKAYHQGYVKEEFRKYTAFSTPWGLYEWIRVPMGISNAPPAFQRFINQVLVGLRDRVCLAYLDDILVYGRTFEEQLTNLRLVLQRLKSKGIKLQGDKCKFFKKEVRYLGRLISKDGHRPDPADTAALEKFKVPPKNIGELRTLLGFLGYYRSYIKDFSRKFKPIYDLLKSKGEKKKNKKKKETGQKDSTASIEWTNEFQEIVDSTVNYLQSPEFLVFPDFTQPFSLNCDASEKGLGAVLYQKRDGKNRVVSYASRTLTDPERNYHLHSGKLEFLGLKWAVTEKFSDYLTCSEFTVFTDNNPLTYVMSSAKLNATGLRWVAELANFQFSIQYKPGKSNNDADGLSRFPMSLEELEKHCTEKLRLEDLAAVMAVRLYSEPATCSERIDVSMLQLEEEKPEVKLITKEEIKEEQMVDEVLGPVYGFVQEKKKPTAEQWKELNTKSKLVVKQFKSLVMEDGMMMRVTKKRKQLVLPEKFHELVFQELHCKLGHLGVEKVEELARQRFYWPYLKEDIEFFIRQRCRCVASKKPNIPEKALLTPIISTAPFEMLCIDFLHLDKSQGCEYVLMVTDHFTKFTQSYGTKDKSSLSAARKLFYEWIPKFGMPERIHHDKGPEFNSTLFAELHRLSGIKISNTTPYHPMGNGEAERMNRSLINMLKALTEKQKSKWKDQLPNLMFAYNSTVHKSTGYSPFFLVFGRESRLPIDCILPIAPHKTNRKSYDKFVKEWKQSMRDAYQIVGQNIEKAGKANKKRYDAKAKSVQIAVGDKVLVRNTEKGGTGKLRSWWEQKIYKVTEIQELVPVYTIRPIDGGTEKTVHRNMLMKVSNMPDNIFGQQPEAEEIGRKKRKVLRKRRSVRSEAKSETLDSTGDSDVIVIGKRVTLLTDVESATSREARADQDPVDENSSENPIVAQDRVSASTEGEFPAIVDHEPADANPDEAVIEEDEQLAADNREEEEDGVELGVVPVVGDAADEMNAMESDERNVDPGMEAVDELSSSEYDDEVFSDDGLAVYDQAENSTDDVDLRHHQTERPSSTDSSLVADLSHEIVTDDNTDAHSNLTTTCSRDHIECECSNEYSAVDESESGIVTRGTEPGHVTLSGALRESEVEASYADDEKSEAEMSECESEDVADTPSFKSGEGNCEVNESSPDTTFHGFDSDGDVTLHGSGDFEGTVKVDRTNLESSDTASEYLSAVDMECDDTMLEEEVKKVRKSSREKKSRTVMTYDKLGYPKIVRYDLLGICKYK